MVGPISWGQLMQWTQLHCLPTTESCQTTIRAGRASGGSAAALLSAPWDRGWDERDTSATLHPIMCAGTSRDDNGIGKERDKEADLFRIL